MPAPKKKIMGKGESAVSVGVRMIRAGKAEGYSAIRGTKKAGFKLKPKPNTKAEPTSNVKKRRSTTDEQERSLMNRTTDKYKQETKSGKNARVSAKNINDINKFGNVKKKPTVKITGK
jgi:hypothetical protein